MQYCHLHKGVNTADDATTSHKNLVNFGAVTPEITFLICVCTFVWLLGTNRPTISIRYASISKRVELLKCRWAHLKQRQYIYILYKFGRILSRTSADNAA